MTEARLVVLMNTAGFENLEPRTSSFQGFGDEQVEIYVKYRSVAQKEDWCQTINVLTIFVK
jgi:hypothetical protein